MDREARKARVGADVIRILPPHDSGDVWHGSSHVDSWEQTRQLIKRRGGLLRANR